MSGMGSIEFDGLIQLKKNLEAAIEGMPKLQERCANALVDRLKEHAIFYTPVDTGKLKDGWRIKRAKFANGEAVAQLFNTVKYAYWVEHGHRTGHVEGGEPNENKRLTLKKGGTFVQTGFQTGRFMLKNARKALDMEKDEIVSRHFNKFLRAALRGGGSSE